jgi:hypothetical protein
MQCLIWNKRRTVHSYQVIRAAQRRLKDAAFVRLCTNFFFFLWRAPMEEFLNLVPNYITLQKQIFNFILRIFPWQFPHCHFPFPFITVKSLFCRSAALFLLHIHNRHIFHQDLSSYINSGSNNICNYRLSRLTRSCDSHILFIVCMELRSTTNRTVCIVTTFKPSFFKIGQHLLKFMLEELMTTCTRQLQNSVVSFLTMKVHYKQSVGDWMSTTPEHNVGKRGWGLFCFYVTSGHIIRCDMHSTWGGYSISLLLVLQYSVI